MRAGAGAARREAARGSETGARLAGEGAAWARVAGAGWGPSQGPRCQIPPSPAGKMQTERSPALPKRSAVAGAVVATEGARVGAAWDILPFCS